MSKFFFSKHNFAACYFSSSVCTNNREKAGNGVINILTTEDMENTPARVQDVVLYEFYEWCSFVSI